MDRRTFLQCASAGTLAAPLLRLGDTAAALAPRVDRRARLARHSPVVRTFESYNALSVGNGGFAFTTDATGLQTFPDEYKDLPLATQAEWAWHSYPNPNGYRAEDAMVLYDAHGRTVPYASGQNAAAGKWLRENPHRLSLARIGFVLRNRDGSPARSSQLGAVRQRLDLWTGTIESDFTVDGRQVHVSTWAHPQKDVISVRVESAALDAQWLGIRIAFPYGGATHTGDPADWANVDKHSTEITTRDRMSVEWHRILDADEHWTNASWSDGATLRTAGTHEFMIEPAPNSAVFECCVGFTTQQDQGILPTATATRDASASHWNTFWSAGGTLDLSQSSDPRAEELERRIVLSEYLTAIQCAGTMPPQETGETFNSWFGKSHLEMHWWHAAHFPLWGRAPMLERSLPWYQGILSVARANAERQGYRGVRWPKMVGPEGRDSPSGVGVFLIWQQPHPIYLAELVYRARPSAAVLQHYSDIVFESAEFMASYPVWDAATKRYILGPPLIPAQESHPPVTTFNPTFELAYWGFGLETAQRWRQRLGMKRNAEWDKVQRGLSFPTMRDGMYVNAESAPTTFTDAAQRRDHPTLLGAYGFIASHRIDKRAMRRTLRKVMDTWDWPDTWGWDYPLVAMTAARVGEPGIAVDALLMDTPKNRYHPNGHNYQRAGLAIYLPGNGGLLTATAMMAAGWDGAPAGHAPGFPRTGWNVRAEGLKGLP